MDELEARQVLHDEVYAPVFRKKFAELTGIDLATPEEEAAMHMTVYRLKQAEAAQVQALTQVHPMYKQALMAQMNQMAGNVLDGTPSQADYQAIAEAQRLGPWLDAVNL